MAKAKTAPVNVRNRVRELRWLKASELVPNEENWRSHPESQRRALRGILQGVGLAGAVLAWETLIDGEPRLKLIDGHLRQDELKDSEEEIPVLVLDVNDDEAAMILATYDLVGDRAKSEKQQWAKLMRSPKIRKQLRVVGDDTCDMFSEHSEKLGVTGRDLPEEGAQLLEEELPQQQAVSSSVVKQVQLFLTQTTYPLFETWIMKLAERYGTDNISDTVYLALKNQFSETGTADANLRRTAVAFMAAGLEHAKLEVTQGNGRGKK